MPKPFKSRRDERLEVLLRDYGFVMNGSALVMQGIRGFTSARIMGTFQSIFSAAEHLIPIIHEDEYTKRFNNTGEKQ